MGFLQLGGSTQHGVSVEPEAVARLQAHDWPGNIRESRNVLERARLFADDGIVRAEHLAESVGHPGGGAVDALPASASTSTRGQADNAELPTLVQAGQFTRLEMARKPGLSERTLYRRLKESPRWAGVSQPLAPAIATAASRTPSRSGP